MHGTKLLTLEDLKLIFKTGFYDQSNPTHKNDQWQAFLDGLSREYVIDRKLWLNSSKYKYFDFRGR